MKTFDTTKFTRIQTPVMILANIMLLMVLIFLSPEWIFGASSVYPPYTKTTNIETAIKDAVLSITPVKP
jgi:hypothetical protein